MNAPSELVARLEAILPQTQCRQCGYDGCRPYASALAAGEADINRCPPGGDIGANRLAALLNRSVRPIDTECGTPKRVATRVVIDEQVCIGCTKCIQACPVDAIVGASQNMHTVIAAECTGCELCIPPCPVDCISVVPAQVTGADYYTHVEAQRPLAYRRYHAREARLIRVQQEQAEAREQRKTQVQAAPAAATPASASPAPVDDPVARALAAARARRAQTRNPNG